jgi:hypothetical protein
VDPCLVSILRNFDRGFRQAERFSMHWHFFLKGKSRRIILLGEGPLLGWPSSRKEIRGMAAINKENERKLLAAAEKALEEAGYGVAKRKFKHYTIEKDGVRQHIIVRTSTDRWLGFSHGPDGWRTLGDVGIEGVIIATYDVDVAKDDPSEIVVYPLMAREPLRQRFDKARAAKTGKSALDERTWICLDPRNTGKFWDTGSGIVSGLAPIARYRLRPQSPQVGVAETISGIGGIAPKRGSISMVVDLDEEERRSFAEHFARRLEVDPGRLLVEVRLTFLA